MFDLKRFYKFDSGLHYVVPYCQHLLHAVVGGSTPPMTFDLLGMTQHACKSLCFELRIQSSHTFWLNPYKTNGCVSI